MYLIIVSS